MYLFSSDLLSDWVCCSTPTGVETPDVIDLRKQQRKEPDRPLYQVIIYPFSDIVTFTNNILLSNNLTFFSR